MPETPRFLRLTFDGGRFVEHSAPVEIMSELGTIQQILLEVAKALFFAANGERARLPKGFAQAAELHLVASEANCFSADLTRVNEGKRDPLFSSARELTLAALEAVEAGRPLPTDFPQSALTSLASLGRKLLDDESLMIRDSDNGRAAKVDQHSRSRLANLIHRAVERFQELDGEVEIFDDGATTRCKIRTRENVCIWVPLTVEQRKDVVEALEQRPIALVRARGIVVQSKNETSRMKQLDSLEVIDDERAPEVRTAWARLDSFSRLEEGWLHEGSPPPTSAAKALARGVIARLLVSTVLPKPAIFPRPDGGVQAEWGVPPWAIDLGFDPTGESIDLAMSNVDTRENREQVFASSSVNSESVLALVLEMLPCFLAPAAPKPVGDVNV